MHIYNKLDADQLFSTKEYCTLVFVCALLNKHQLQIMCYLSYAWNINRSSVISFMYLATFFVFFFNYFFSYIYISIDII